MKITKQLLKRLVKEELNYVLREERPYTGPLEPSGDANRWDWAAGEREEVNARMMQQVPLTDEELEWDELGCDNQSSERCEELAAAVGDVRSERRERAHAEQDMMDKTKQAERQAEICDPDMTWDEAAAFLRSRRMNEYAIDKVYDYLTGDRTMPGVVKGQLAMSGLNGKEQLSVMNAAVREASQRNPDRFGVARFHSKDVSADTAGIASGSCNRLIQFLRKYRR